MACADAGAASSSAAAEQPGEQHGEQRAQRGSRDTRRSRRAPTARVRRPRGARSRPRTQPGGSARSARSSAISSTRPISAPTCVASRSAPDRPGRDVAHRQRAEHDQEGRQQRDQPGRAARHRRRGDERGPDRQVPRRGLVRGVRRHRHADAVAGQRRQPDRAAGPARPRAAPPQPVPPAQHPAGGQRDVRGDRRRTGRAPAARPGGPAGWRGRRPRPIGHNRGRTRGGASSAMRTGRAARRPDGPTPPPGTGHTSRMY